MRRLILPLIAAALVLAGCAVPEEPTAVQPPEAEEPTGKSKAAKKAVPIKLSAKRARAARSVLSDGSDLSCVRVTVTNQTRKNLEVNPLYFSITDSGGTKHDTSSALADYEGQIDTTTLAPREKATGLVCARGSFRPKVLAMTNPLFSEAARAEVA